ncbi:response regulator transcription factor [Domibacillus enclensis]|uniref:DNA-binding response regulator n=1 Tax=Domibacillus enclensis TaxID=1017273 RepID=A0A1N6Q788_9BACI|nr:response regulator transcription factor [Domibacillus enclensis]OXS80605.1 DNA-binding response regulator [Domibacillus enclensis]SIQ12326.1 two-component system, OmpR family, alkaline phosphatase synthesis response regulator PhoP [Domibacillus enclensis]
MKKILVVDDEPSIVTLIKYNLEQAGFEVETAYDGEEALRMAEETKPDLMILDWMLPKFDGMEVCKDLRQRRVTIPILMLTAKDEEFDKVLGLELGADDYMTKPFSPRELIARVKAILRRVQQAPSEPVIEEEEEDDSELIKVAELKLYPEKYEAYYKKQLMELTPKEFELLLFLAENKTRVLTRDQLLAAVWKYDFVGDTRIVDVHISHLRDKMEENTKKPRYIKTIRGLGYKLEEPKEA